MKRFLVAFCGYLLMSGPALAHAADQGFVLLLPTRAYITGGTIAVAATILLLLGLRVGWLARVFNPRPLPFKDSALGPPAWVPLAASMVLAALIFVGWQGPTDPQANLLPLVLWTVWWMLLFVFQAVFFDVWRWVSPWPGLHRVLFPKGTALWVLPERLSVWPAVVVMGAFQGFVLADAAPNDPDRLASFAAGYWMFTLAGMSFFGREPWLRQGECFTALFDLLGRLRALGRGQIGAPGWQLFQGIRLDLSHAAFVLVILAAGSFDGLYETFWWLAQIGVNPLEYPGRSALVWPTTIGLLGGIALLTLIFGFAIWIGIALTRSAAVRYSQAFIAFALTLLPIAVGYHFAHYLVTFLVQIQVVTATLADPLARGWNLFGLGDTRVMVGFLTVPGTVKTIWLTQAGVVVLSHILAVILSHRTAETLVSSRSEILKIQVGLSILMIFYTIFGLWLLASPRGA